MMHLIKVQWTFLFIILMLIEVTEMNYTCPPSRMAKPCKCSYSPENQKTMLECYDLDDTDEKPLKDAISAFDKQEISVISFNKTYLNSLDRNLFIDHLTAEKVLIYNASIINISLFGTFHGMENTLYEVEILNSFLQTVTLESAEKFTQLRKFRLSGCIGLDKILKLTYHEPPVVYYSNLTFLIPYLPKQITFITINSCEIKTFQDHCFRRFTNLHKLDLSHNQLGTVSRNCLPLPASNLSSYDLSFNPITFLPDDAFVEMPALEKVSLEGTRLSKLHYHIFRPVLKQLKSLAIKNIPLICDCDSAWLLTKVKLWHNSGKTPGILRCIFPISLKNREVDSIIPFDMCMNCDEFLQLDKIYDVEENEVVSESSTKGVGNYDEFMSFIERRKNSSFPEN